MHLLYSSNALKLVSGEETRAVLLFRWGWNGRVRRRRILEGDCPGHGHSDFLDVAAKENKEPEKQKEQRYPLPIQDRQGLG